MVSAAHAREDGVERASRVGRLLPGHGAALIGRAVWTGV